MIARLIFTGILWLLAGQLKATRDAQSSGEGADRLSGWAANRWPGGSWWRRFWSVKYGWKNKYRGYPHDMRPAWPGATTWAVMGSDWWHLSQFLATIFQTAAVALWLVPAAGWWSLLCLVPGVALFEPAYRYWRKA